MLAEQEDGGFYHSFWAICSQAELGIYSGLIHFLCLNNFLVQGDCRREYFRAWVLSSKTLNNNSWTLVTLGGQFVITIYPYMHEFCFFCFGTYLFQPWFCSCNENANWNKKWKDWKSWSMSNEYNNNNNQALVPKFGCQLWVLYNLVSLLFLILIFIRI